MANGRLWASGAAAMLAVLASMSLGGCGNGANPLAQGTTTESPTGAIGTPLTSTPGAGPLARTGVSTSAGALTTTGASSGLSTARSSTSGTGATSATGGSGATAPPCTVAALTAAAQGPTFDAIDTTAFGCAGNFAYAGVTLGAPPAENEVTEFFMARGGSWVAVDRTPYCNGGLVPAAIFQNSCNTN